MFFPDVIKFFNRLGVRSVNEPAADGAPPADVSAATDGALRMPVAAAVLPLHATNAASSSALGDGLPVARAVPVAPSSSLVLPPGCFVVTCKNASMYGKKMRDVHMAGYSKESDKVIRFRSMDGKVMVADLLVEVGRYGTVKQAQEAMYKFIEQGDDKISDLESLEVDNDLFSEKVCIFLKYLNICTRDLWY